MKTINGHFTQEECANQPGRWPERVEESYERLVSAVTGFATGERHGNGTSREAGKNLNRFAL